MRKSPHALRLKASKARPGCAKGGETCGKSHGRCEGLDCIDSDCWTRRLPQKSKLSTPAGRKHLDSGTVETTRAEMIPIRNGWLLMEPSISSILTHGASISFDLGIWCQTATACTFGAGSDSKDHRSWIASLHCMTRHVFLRRSYYPRWVVYLKQIQGWASKESNRKRILAKLSQNDGQVLSLAGSGFLSLVFGMSSSASCLQNPDLIPSPARKLAHATPLTPAPSPSDLSDLPDPIWPMAYGGHS